MSYINIGWYIELVTLVNNQIYVPTVQNLNSQQTMVNDSKSVGFNLAESGLPINIAKIIIEIIAQARD